MTCKGQLFHRDDGDEKAGTYTKKRTTALLNNSLLHFVIINENGPARDRPRCIIYNVSEDGNDRRFSLVFRWYASFEWLISIKRGSEKRVFFFFISTLLSIFLPFSLTLVNLRHLKSTYHLSVELFKQKYRRSLYENARGTTWKNVSTYCIPHRATLTPLMARTVKKTDDFTWDWMRDYRIFAAAKYRQHIYVLP